MVAEAWAAAQQQAVSHSARVEARVVRGIRHACLTVSSRAILYRV